MKTCSKCGLEKPLGEFDRRSDRPDGLTNHCKACVKAYNAAYRAAHAQELKPKKAAWQHANRERLNALARAQRSKKRVSERRWRNANRDRRNETERVWRAKNPDKVHSYMKKWRSANMERHLAYQVRWLEAHPTARAERNARRRARVRGQRVGVVDYQAILARDGYICHLCGGEVAPDELEFDHIIPIAKGGAHSMENISVAHGSCNRRKCANLHLRSAPAAHA